MKPSAQIPRTSLLAAAGRVARHLDPRLRPPFIRELLRQLPGGDALPDTIVLVGQRGAGKTFLLPVLSEILERAPIDLDVHIEAREGIPVRALFAQGEVRFREAERAAFLSLARPGLIAVGGGLLPAPQGPLGPKAGGGRPDHLRDLP